MAGSFQKHCHTLIVLYKKIERKLFMVCILEGSFPALNMHSVLVAESVASLDQIYVDLRTRLRILSTAGL
jgi:hypothetical protein